MLPQAIPHKQTEPEHWLDGALLATEGADAVCVDLDNGVAPDAKMYRKDGPKFVCTSDLRALWERGQSLVVYYHFGRTDSAGEQIRAKANTLRDELQAGVVSLRFRAGSSRVFYVIPQPKHEELIKRRVGRLLDGAWAEHFEWVW